ncbi:hypothetical protein BS47DRAFT_1362289 [Hydnum rufescens UP504]|uniref:Uncharacterized protein n=1 Tax=Hydnum rufescens UP504 TaxID=1448309 RepID=A0A9P6AXD1_9AGAM|nr:hypothetical protein BS47DRAFT_1362289 [Hydnum rufescens UP504]
MGPRVFPPPSLPHTRGKEVSRRSKWGMWVLLPEPDGASLVKTRRTLRVRIDNWQGVSRNVPNPVWAGGFEGNRLSQCSKRRPWDGSPLIALVGNLLLFGFEVRQGIIIPLTLHAAYGFLTGTPCLNGQFSKHPTKVGDTLSGGPYSKTQHDIRVFVSGHARNQLNATTKKKTPSSTPLASCYFPSLNL